MELVGYSFTDCVSGEDVYKFKDSNGTLWHKNNWYSLFKVKID